MAGKIILVFSILAAGMFLPAHAGMENPPGKDTIRSSIPPSNTPGTADFSPDFNHRLNFRYPGERKGLKPFIAPAVLISGGTTLHFMKGTKENVHDYVRENFPYHGHFDDYAQYAPFVAVYALYATGNSGKNNLGNKTALALKSFLLNGIITDRTKEWAGVQRPNGENRSFPSGHTSKAFSLAHFMHKEYGEQSPWFSIGAYSCAASVGLLRMAKDAHWISDVLAGAGIGILSTELVYLTHQYKWDKEHLRRFDIFPFQFQKQKGVSLVVRF